MYTPPQEYMIRLHHIRPRFKSDIENVLVYMASEIAKIPSKKRKQFANDVNEAVRRYPGNSNLPIKTINNWRTEISALFGFIERDGEDDLCGLRASELAETGDLVRLFKTFLYTFQYPGAHIKAEKIKELIVSGVKFKPAQRILQILKAGEKISGSRAYLAKHEVCHMIFNDLRVVRENEPPEKTWERIFQNRADNVVYNKKGDVTRYAGDIIDYMLAANLLVTYDSKKYYINSLEEETVQKFILSTEWFGGYDSVYEKLENNSDCEPSLDEINAQKDDWFYYVNRGLLDTDFSTDVIAFLSDGIGADSTDGEVVSDSAKYFKELLESGAEISTKEIGDFGEALVIAHEKARLIKEGADHLIHLITRVPTPFAIGYDINSREVDERHRFIEVKTTISSKPIQQRSFRLTRNEWNSAETSRGQYFIYRLMVSKEQIKLYIISDPVGLYKRDIISMAPTEGAAITFNPDTAGSYEELLS